MPKEEVYDEPSWWGNVWKETPSPKPYGERGGATGMELYLVLWSCIHHISPLVSSRKGECRGLDTVDKIPGSKYKDAPMAWPSIHQQLSCGLLILMTTWYGLV